MAGQMRLIDQFAVEHDLQVAGAFELLEDHFVHAAAGVDQGRGDDRQRAAFFDLAGGAEESLGPLQGVGVDAAGEDLARVRALGVPGPGQRVIESRKMITSRPYSTIRLAFSRTISETWMWRADRLVESRADHFAVLAL